MPVMVPLVSDLNFTPSSTALSKPISGTFGTELALQIVINAGGGTVTVIPAEGVSMFPLSSIARLRMLIVPDPETVQLYVQLPLPVALCHVAPPSVDTS